GSRGQRLKRDAYIASGICSQGEAGGGVRGGSAARDLREVPRGQAACSRRGSRQWRISAIDELEALCAIHAIGRTTRSRCRKGHRWRGCICQLFYGRTGGWVIE